MKIDNPELLKRFRTPGNCESCGRRCEVREPSHLIHSGMGGCPLDIRLNIVAQGSTRHWCCTCHHDHGQGRKPTYKDMLATVARREGCEPEDVDRLIRLFRRLPTDRWEAELKREKLTKVQRRLADKTVAEMPAKLKRSA